MKLNHFVFCIAGVILSASAMWSRGASVTATDGGTTVYGSCNGFAIDFDATVAPSAVWTPSLSAGQTYAINSVSLKNASGNTGNYYLGVYTGFSGGSLSGFKGVSDAANNFATSPNGWLTFTFSNINYVVTADFTAGSGSGMVYFVYQSGTSALSSPNVTLGTERFGADTYMTNSLAGIIAFGGVVANRSPQYQATITPALPTLPVCYVNTTSNIQVMDGFGFSDGWSGTLSSAKNNALYNTIGMTIFRAFVNTNSGKYATPVANIQAAHAASATVFATGWCPTGWASPTTNHCLPVYYPDYANWLNTQAVSKNIDYISPFNEPDGSTNDIRWTPTEILNFIKTNAPAIGKPILMPESIGFNNAYSDPVLNDSMAVSNIIIVAGHFYGNGNYVHTNAIAHGKHVWETEHLITGSSTDISQAMVLAKEVSDAMNNQFSAYCWWWVNDNVTDGSDLVLSDGTIFKNGYVLGQFARWIRPGMVRCNSTYNPAGGAFVTAYLGNTNGVVIVALNTNLTATSLTITTQNATNVSRFAAYRTSDSEGMVNVAAAVVTSNSFSYTLPGQSVTTFAQYFGSIPTTAPASLAATVAPSGQIKLTWSAVTNISRYSVKRSTTNGGPYTTVAYGVTGTNFTDMVYNTGATYYYVVSAVNDGGESPDSSQVSGTTAARVNIEPVADSYVNDGSSTNSNFGTLTNLVIKNDGGTNTGFNRISYLRFDVRALTNAQSVKLILTPVKVDGNIPLSFEQVTNGTWSETGITWNNQPGGSGVIFTNLSGYTVNVPVIIDLTTVVTNLAANVGYLSLRVIDTNALNTRIDFYSKEASNSNYHPVLQITNSLVPANTAPVLAAITNRIIGAGVTMSITNIATDSDLPAQTLTFSLPTAPTNAAINASSGVLTWRPLVTQANSTNPFTVIVADNGTPSMSATQSFTVTVSPLIKSQISLSANSGQLNLQISGAAGPDYQIQSSADLVNWSAVLTTNSPAMPFTWTTNTSGPPLQFFRILAGPPFP